MKNSKLNVFAASMILGSVLLSGQVMADKEDRSKERPDREVIKVKAKEGSDIKVMVGSKGEKNKYTFSAEELENMNNVAAKLSDLDEATSAKVLALLTQLSANDAKEVELKTMNMKRGDKESKVVMVKTANAQGLVHIEIDIESDSKKHEKRLLKSLFANGKNGHKHKKDGHKPMKKGERDGEKRDVAKMLTKMIKKSDLTDEQVAELKILLDSKNS